MLGVENLVWLWLTSFFACEQHGIRRRDATAITLKGICQALTPEVHLPHGLRASAYWLFWSTRSLYFWFPTEASEATHTLTVSPPRWCAKALALRTIPLRRQCIRRCTSAGLRVSRTYNVGGCAWAWRSHHTILYICRRRFMRGVMFSCHCLWQVKEATRRKRRRVRNIETPHEWGFWIHAGCLCARWGATVAERYKNTLGSGVLRAPLPIIKDTTNIFSPLPLILFWFLLLVLLPIICWCIFVFLLWFLLLLISIFVFSWYYDCVILFGLYQSFLLQ